MTHTIHEKQKLLSRVKRIRGLVNAIERGIENEDESDQILHLIAGVRGAISGLMAEIIEDHIRVHLLTEQPDGEHGSKLESAEELFEALRTYLK
jgi:DNA-binding FrmR family transcriptional regulator